MIQTTIDILVKQKKNFSDLRELTIKKQKALSSSDNTAIQEVISREEKLFVTIQAVERERKEILRKIAVASGVVLPQNKPLKASDILRVSAKQNDLTQILEIEKHIRVDAIEIKKINQRNMFLIKMLKQFIDDLMVALIGNKQRVLIDRKA